MKLDTNKYDNLIQSVQHQQHHEKNRSNNNKKKKYAGDPVTKEKWVQVNNLDTRQKQLDIFDDAFQNSDDYSSDSKKQPDYYGSKIAEYITEAQSSGLDTIQKLSRTINYIRNTMHMLGKEYNDLAHKVSDFKWREKKCRRIMETIMIEYNDDNNNFLNLDNEQKTAALSSVVLRTHINKYNKTLKSLMIEIDQMKHYRRQLKRSMVFLSSVVHDR